jgi:hypothetical protein
MTPILAFYRDVLRLHLDNQSTASPPPALLRVRHSSRCLTSRGIDRQGKGPVDSSFMTTTVTRAGGSNKPIIYHSIALDVRMT